MLRNVRGTSHSITRGSILSLGLILVQFLSAAAVLAIDIVTVRIGAGNESVDTVLASQPYFLDVTVEGYGLAEVRITTPRGAELELFEVMPGVWWNELTEFSSLDDLRGSPRVGFGDFVVDLVGNQGEIDTVTLFLDPDPYDRFTEFAEILSPDHPQESVTLQPTFQWACTGVCPTRPWDVRIVREDGTWLDRRVPRVSFRVDLDLLAPLGEGAQNAATWFADFTVNDGRRLAEWETAREYRQPKTGERGVFFMPDAPLLLEAERWVDQALMRFHPDVWDSPEANRQGTLNYLMMYDLAGAWVGRGDSRENLDSAMADYRRAVRLGRLVRQEGAEITRDLLGLALIRRGLEPMARRWRAAGENRLADQALLALADVLSQRVMYSRARQSDIIERYLGLSWSGLRLRLPEGKLDEIGRLATEPPERSIRRFAIDQLCFAYWLGSADQRAVAEEWMDQAMASGDPLARGKAECAEEEVKAELSALFRSLGLR